MYDSVECILIEVYAILLYLQYIDCDIHNTKDVLSISDLVPYTGYNGLDFRL